MAKKATANKAQTKKVETVETANIAVVEQAQATAPVQQVEEKPQLGRPVNPNSERQQRLKKEAELRAAGLLKRGRPVVEGSKHQQKLAEQAKRREENGGVARRGRPTDPNSPRQQRLKEATERKAAGLVNGPGRPSTKNNPAAAVEVQVEG